MEKVKIVRITTVPISLGVLLKGQLKYMSYFYEVIGISSGPTSELDAISERENIPTFEVPMTRKITPIRDVFAILKLYFLLKKIQPEIVHTHTPKAGLVGMAAAWMARVPIRMHTVAGLPLVEAKGIKRNVLGIVEKVTYALATKIYPNSNGLKEIILKEKFCSKDKISVIHHGSSNGIDTKHFSKDTICKEEINRLRSELHLTPEYFVFVFVGRIVRDKGIVELVEAFKKLYEEFSQIRLLLVGNTEPDLDPLPKQTEETIHSHPAILSVGFQKDVRPYYMLSDVLVFPSYREGFPNVVLQAGAMELPSIVSDINGCNEIIQHEVNGLIISPKNTEQLYQAMRRLMLDDALRMRLKNAARPIVEEKFRQEIVWEALRDEYERLLTEYRNKQKKT